jgi:hypothetical protein
MKALKNHANRAAATPLLADDVLEFHAGRLVLLLATCGGGAGAINGLTKMAKLDFFVRYPYFFEAVRRGADQPTADRALAVEAAMTRHHYGPWDKRYYHVLAFLKPRRLITVKKSGKSFRIALTKTGKAVAKRLASSSAFSGLRVQMQRVAESLGDKTGNQLKTLIYATFSEEVGRRPLGHVIEVRHP